MRSASLASAKAKFSAVIDEVHGAHERVTVTLNGRPVAVTVSLEDLASMEETIARRRHRVTQQMASATARRWGAGPSS